MFVETINTCDENLFASNLITSQIYIKNIVSDVHYINI